MSEHEKRLRTLLEALPFAVAAQIRQLHEDALSAARDAALEEAAHWFEDSAPGAEWDATAAAAEMRALKPRPAERYIPEAKVQALIVDVRAALRELRMVASEGVVAALEREARRLGVDLDAAPVEGM